MYASERNWSRWGLVFIPNRNLLGLEQASKLVYIQSNDPMTRVARGYDAFIEKKLADSGMAKCLYHHKSPFKA